GDVLQRMKTLAAQLMSGVPTDAERAFIDAEYQALIKEIDGIAATTRFNGESLLDGTSDQFKANVDFFVGTDKADVIGVNLAGITAVADYKAATLGLTANVKKAADAATAMGQVDTALDTISEARANVG